MDVKLKVNTIECITVMLKIVWDAGLLGIYFLDAKYCITFRPVL